MKTRADKKRRLFIRNLKTLGIDVHGQTKFVDLLLLADMIGEDPEITWNGNEDQPWELSIKASLSDMIANRITVNDTNVNDLIHKAHNLLTKGIIYVHNTPKGLLKLKFATKNKVWTQLKQEPSLLDL